MIGLNASPRTDNYIAVGVIRSHFHEREIHERPVSPIAGRGVAGSA